MANNGARAFYLMLEKVKETLLADKNVNTVTYGDLTDVDLSKQTIFPLSHIVINSASNDSQTMTFNITVICMDVVDVSKTDPSRIFDRNESEHFILNTQLAVTNRLYQLLNIGQLRQDGFAVDGEANCEPFVDRFSNNLAGWAITLDLIVKNDIFLC